MGKSLHVTYVILFMISISFALHYSPHTSHACSCVESGPVQEELERSSAVFSGEVIEIVDKNKNNSMQSSADAIAVLFEVEESWKGVNQTEVVIYTERSSASCGFEFTLNNNYLVYANEMGGDLKVSLCSRTALLSSATEDLEELGESERPTEQTSIDLTTGSSTNYYIYVALLVVGLLFGVVYVIRRTKDNVR